MTGNHVKGKLFRGFESLSLRHQHDLKPVASRPERRIHSGAEGRVPEGGGAAPLGSWKLRNVMTGRDENGVAFLDSISGSLAPVFFA